MCGKGGRYWNQHSTYLLVNTALCAYPASTRTIVSPEARCRGRTCGDDVASNTLGPSCPCSLLPQPQIVMPSTPSAKEWFAPLHQWHTCITMFETPHVKVDQHRNASPWRKTVRSRGLSYAATADALIAGTVVRSQGSYSATASSCCSCIFSGTYSMFARIILT